MFIIFVALILRNVEDFSQTERLVAKKQNNKKKNTKKSKKQKKNCLKEQLERGTCDITCTEE